MPLNSSSILTIFLYQFLLNHYQLVVGVLAAQIITVFLVSGLVAPALLNLSVVLAVAMAAGFSEQIVNRVLDDPLGEASTPPTP